MALAGERLSNVILYDLICDKDHDFEVWFRDSDTCAAQLAAKEVPCPTCGSSKVSKALMAPNVTGKSAGKEIPADASAAATLPTKAAMETEEAGKLRRALAELRDKVERDFDHVGPQFAEEARKIHYGETEHRNIYGETTAEEAKDLADEGIEVSRIPWVPKDNS